MAVRQAGRLPYTVDLGTGGNVTLDVNAGDFANKEYFFNASSTIILEKPLRSGEYTFWLGSSDAGVYDLTWSPQGGATIATDYVFPGFVDNLEKQPYVLSYTKQNLWYWVNRDFNLYTDVDGTALSGNWAIDCRMSGFNVRVTGVMPSGVNLKPPTNAPIGVFVNIIFDAVQTELLTIADGDFTRHTPKPVLSAVNGMVQLKNTFSGWHLSALEALDGT